MDDNSLLVIILAFILGCMCSGMMEQMCGGRLVEGSFEGGMLRNGYCDDLGNKSIAPINCFKVGSDYTCTMCDRGNYGSPLALDSSITDTTQNFNFDNDVIKVICSLNDPNNCDTKNNKCSYNCSYTENKQTFSMNAIRSRNGINNTMLLDSGNQVGTQGYDSNSIGIITRGYDSNSIGPVPVKYIDINWLS